MCVRDLWMLTSCSCQGPCHAQGMAACVQLACSFILCFTVFSVVVDRLSKRMLPLGQNWSLMKQNTAGWASVVAAPLTGQRLVVSFYQVLTTCCVER